jgi:tRNA nucleotidyltransferase/poly(A) polymerase
VILPPEVRRVLTTLAARGFSAEIVGGAVRDLLTGRQVLDWDVATSAPPETVRAAFVRTVPTGIKHGTVTVLEGRLTIEVTTYRTETGYSDFRRPDQVVFVRDLMGDLARRDFTVNAMALDRRGRLIDRFGGREDLIRRMIRAVGKPGERFGEDALRMLRAVRFATQLDFTIEPATFAAIKAKSHLLDHVSGERIRDELVRTLLTRDPAGGLELMRETGLLARVIPELLAGYGFEQNEHHAHSVWEHALIATETVPPVTHLRLAALLHDVAKPACLSVQGGTRHFFDHERVGAKMASVILRRLKFDNATIQKVVHLIRHHMSLHYNASMKDPAIRRLVSRVGLEHMPDLLELRRADRRASGKKPGPVSRGTLRLLGRIERVLAKDAAFGLKDMAADGLDVMRWTGLAPGPRVGLILRQMLDAVLENPDLNSKERLEPLARELAARGASGAGEPAPPPNGPPAG